MSTDKIPQHRRILGYLRMHGSITPIQAIRVFNCYRLGARIWELRQDGHRIRSRLIKSRNDKHFCQYILER